ncbi:Oxidoreductase, molybdopterin-binding domain-containing protein [Irpex lacteus]|nr:Oxidoreductase, molybdopterin-binding domain-containing protein [Irpex lacteus]
MASNKVIVHDEKPYNAEPPLETLVQHHITPVDLVYARNHGPIERLDGATFKLKVDGLIREESLYTLEDLRNTFPKVEVVAALQCAGNRRKVMQERKNAEVEGILWGEGTIANVRWGGARLRDILLRAGVSESTDAEEGLHVCFASHVAACQEDDWFGSSVPLHKALDESGDALLAYELNGELLAPEHGYPFRVVVPGHTGARWVKWVDQITVSRRESGNYYHQQDYKVLPPQVKTHEMADSGDWWSKLPPLQAYDLNSVIAVTKVDPTTRTLNVKGYALGGPSGQVKGVEISVDEGRSWSPAKITYQEGRWSWTLWEASVGISDDSELHGTVCSRAVDEQGNRQSPDTDWNLRGVGYSGFGKREF